MSWVYMDKVFIFELSLFMSLIRANLEFKNMHMHILWLIVASDPLVKMAPPTGNGLGLDYKGNHH